VTLNRLLDSGQPIVPPPDVQRTTLGLDVLSRFICNTWDEATAGSTRQFDAIVIGAGMFGGYCAEKIYNFGAANNLKVLVLDAGPFLIPTHLQNLPDIGLEVPDPPFPANDPGTARDLVWGMAGRGNVPFIGQAYCIGGKSLYWGGLVPECPCRKCYPSRMPLNSATTSATRTNPATGCNNVTCPVAREITIRQPQALRCNLRRKASWHTTFRRSPIQSLWRRSVGGDEGHCQASGSVVAF
jgi:hypothetical protein